MTPAHPQQSPAPIGPVPAPLHPLPKAFSYSGAAIVNIGRRYLSMPTRCYLERFTGLTAAREWWGGDRLMQNTWLIGEGVASIMRPGTEMHTAKVHMAGYPDHISQTSFLDGCCIWGLNIMPNDPFPGTPVTHHLPSHAVGRVGRCPNSWELASVALSTFRV